VVVVALGLVAAVLVDIEVLLAKLLLLELLIPLPLVLEEHKYKAVLEIMAQILFFQQ
jgi:hypothetical protein